MVGSPEALKPKELRAEAVGADEDVIDALRRISAYARRKSLRVGKNWAEIGAGSNAGQQVVYAELWPNADSRLDDFDLVERLYATFERHDAGGSGNHGVMLEAAIELERQRTEIESLRLQLLRHRVDDEATCFCVEAHMPNCPAAPL
jgi:hypothetical protein